MKKGFAFLSILLVPFFGSAQALITLQTNSQDWNWTDFPVYVDDVNGDITHPSIASLSDSTEFDAFVIELAFRQDSTQNPMTFTFWIETLNDTTTHFEGNIQPFDIFTISSWESFEVAAVMTLINGVDGSYLNLWSDFETMSHPGLVTSVSDQKAFTFDVFPNPAHNHIILEVSNISGAISYEILNSVGQIVLSDTTSSEQTRIDTQGLANDVYVLRLVENGHVIHNERVVLLE